MNTDQFNQLLLLLGKIADKQYTITGATDWPMVYVLGGIFVIVFGGMWVDLRGTIKNNKDEWKSALIAHEQAEEKQFDHVWRSQRDCQSDCCPPRLKQNVGQTG
ncbi:MAG: hypothetical protein PHZ02_07340 [Desulfocapsaceae bacterium]|nr:hypothetical protein [Desulfocapsaceae bacterium]